MEHAFVVMSGCPEVARTTLGRGIAAELGLAMLDKDDILDALLESLGPGDPGSRHRLSRASDAALQAIAVNTPAAVLSSFWRRERLSATSVPQPTGRMPCAIPASSRCTASAR
ncbi:MAG: hypothetical protein IPK24_05755 [Kineosporiaceae bacterium]|nr:hypothetical protein [Kineosporiaceae bacterium]